MSLSDPSRTAAPETTDGSSESERAKETLRQEIKDLEAEYEEGMTGILDELKEMGVEKSGKEKPYIGKGCSVCGRENCNRYRVVYYPRGLGIAKNKKIDENRSGPKGTKILKYSGKNQKKLERLFEIQTELKQKRLELEDIVRKRSN